MIDSDFVCDGRLCIGTVRELGLACELHHKCVSMGSSRN